MNDSNKEIAAASQADLEKILGVASELDIPDGFFKFHHEDFSNPSQWSINDDFITLDNLFAVNIGSLRHGYLETAKPSRGPKLYGNRISVPLSQNLSSSDLPLTLSAQENFEVCKTLSINLDCVDGPLEGRSGTFEASIDSRMRWFSELVGRNGAINRHRAKIGKESPFFFPIIRLTWSKRKQNPHNLEKELVYAQFEIHSFDDMHLSRFMAAKRSPDAVQENPEAPALDAPAHEPLVRTINRRKAKEDEAVTGAREADNG